jgi:hypothetical protein
MASAKTKGLKVVLPGDVVENEDTSKAKKLRLGPGLRQDIFDEGKAEPDIIATKCGILRSDKTSSFWVDTNQRRV